MKKLLAHIVYYKLEPTNLSELITHIERVIQNETKTYPLRNYTLMLNTLKDLKLYDVNHSSSRHKQGTLINLLETFEHLIVDELMWRNIEKEAHQRRSLYFKSNPKKRSE